MPLEIKILIDEQAGLTVSGAIDTPIQAFGLLEMGRQALADHYRKINDRLVQPVSLAPTFKLD